MSLFKKLQDVFSTSSGTFYMRQDVVKSIKSFLDSKKDFVLHLTGNPGSGKTSMTKFICKNIKHVYLNAYTDDVKKKILFDDKSKVFIVDEFDKVVDSSFIINYIKTRKKKIITLSNSLNNKTSLTGINYCLSSYTSKDIEEIIRCKCKEMSYQILSDSDIKFISKKFGRTGDMRLVFNYIKDNFDNKKKKVIISTETDIKETISDQNIHHKLVQEILQENYDRRKAYSAYIEKCGELKIACLYRNDFYSVYDIYK